MEHKSCINPTHVECANKRRGERSCSKCRDTSFANDFLIKKLKPRSGNLNMGIINMEALPLLLMEFLDHISQNDSNKK